MPPRRITGIINGNAAALDAPASWENLARGLRNPTGPKK
jgi:hypothetical protein